MKYVFTLILLLLMSCSEPYRPVYLMPGHEGNHVPAPSVISRFDDSSGLLVGGGALLSLPASLHFSLGYFKPHFTIQSFLSAGGGPRSVYVDSTEKPKEAELLNGTYSHYFFEGDLRMLLTLKSKKRFRFGIGPGFISYVDGGSYEKLREQYITPLVRDNTVRVTASGKNYGVGFSFHIQEYWEGKKRGGGLEHAVTFGFSRLTGRESTDSYGYTAPNFVQFYLGGIWDLNENHRIFMSSTCAFNEDVDFNIGVGYTFYYTAPF